MKLWRQTSQSNDNPSINVNYAKHHRPNFCHIIRPSREKNPRDNFGVLSGKNGHLGICFQPNLMSIKLKGIYSIALTTPKNSAWKAELCSTISEKAKTKSHKPLRKIPPQEASEIANESSVLHFNQPFGEGVHTTSTILGASEWLGLTLCDMGCNKWNQNNLFWQGYHQLLIGYDKSSKLWNLLNAGYHDPNKTSPPQSRNNMQHMRIIIF